MADRSCGTCIHAQFARNANNVPIPHQEGYCAQAKTLLAVSVRNLEAWLPPCIIAANLDRVRIYPESNAARCPQYEFHVTPKG